MYGSSTLKNKRREIPEPKWYFHCRLGTAKRNNLKDQLVNVVANAIYYNPTLALQALQQQGSLSSYLTAWMQVRSPHHALFLFPPVACQVEAHFRLIENPFAMTGAWSKMYSQDQSRLDGSQAIPARTRPESVESSGVILDNSSTVLVSPLRIPASPMSRNGYERTL